MKEIKANQNITKQLQNAICSKHTGKMEGMLSISTSPKLCKECVNRSQVKGSVCEKCYAIRMLERYKTLAEKLERNTELLTGTVYSPEYFPLLNASLFRLESFADIQNETQVINYFNFCERNKSTTFALWTKNPQYIQMALEDGHKKPSNLIVIYSSPMINHRAENMLKLYGFIDKIFTVWTKEEAEKQGIKINCGSRKCLACRRCYNKRTGIYVDEILK